MFGALYIYISGWALKVRFLAKNQHTHKEKVLKNPYELLRGMSLHQKLDIILQNKVVRKLNLEKNVFNKKWSPKLIFLNEFFSKKFC